MATQITYDEHTKGYIEGMNKAIEVIQNMRTTEGWLPGGDAVALGIVDRLKREVPSV